MLALANASVMIKWHGGCNRPPGKKAMVAWLGHANYQAMDRAFARAGCVSLIGGKGRAQESQDKEVARI